MIKHAQFQATLILISLKLVEIGFLYLWIPLLVALLVLNQVVVIMGSPPIELQSCIPTVGQKNCLDSFRDSLKFGSAFTLDILYIQLREFVISVPLVYQKVMFFDFWGIEYSNEEYLIIDL